MIYKTQGTCSREIHIETESRDGKEYIKSVQYVGGCDGNLKGISKLVAGMEINEVIERLEGTRCGMKPTSCPDQLAKALKQLIA